MWMLWRYGRLRPPPVVQEPAAVVGVPLSIGRTSYTELTSRMQSSSQATAVTPLCQWDAHQGVAVDTDGRLRRWSPSVGDAEAWTLRAGGSTYTMLNDRRGSIWVSTTCWKQRSRSLCHLLDTSCLWWRPCTTSARAGAFCLLNAVGTTGPLRASCCDWRAPCCTRTVAHPTASGTTAVARHPHTLSACGLCDPRSVRQNLRVGGHLWLGREERGGGGGSTGSRPRPYRV